MGSEAHETSADVVVVGGGIVGAAVARDAAMRGWRTVLVEQGDLAHGTSSRSSRLIHGGLRYLEQLELRLVFEALRERAVLRRIAPHLVRPLAFVVPVHAGDRVPRWKLAAGLHLYALLATGRNLGRPRMLSKRGLEALEPALRSRGLLGGGWYWDAQCDDARLTVATARAAAAAGASIRPRTAVTGLHHGGARVAGVTVRDGATGEVGVITARCVVNATGPWCDALRRLEDPAAAPLLRPTKGVHVVVPRDRVGHVHAITFTSPLDGRVMFALPWGRWTHLGTTDTPWHGDPGAVTADAADVTYLLRSANACFPQARLRPHDVVATWAGLRPLVADGAATASGISREHHIVEGPGGLLSIAGGKLTTARLMAAQAMDLAALRLAGAGERPRPRPPTDRTPLPGGEAADVAPLAALGREAGLPEPAITACLARHGTDAAAVFHLVARDRALARPVHPAHHAIAAEVIHVAEREWATTVEDVLVRRLQVAFETPDGGLAAAGAVAACLGAALGWDAGTVRDAAAAYRPPWRGAASPSPSPRSPAAPPA